MSSPAATPMIGETCSGRFWREVRVDRVERTELGTTRDDVKLRLAVEYETREPDSNNIVVVAQRDISRVPEP
jgi:hypothetical protein